MSQKSLHFYQCQQCRASSARTSETDFTCSSTNYDVEVRLTFSGTLTFNVLVEFYPGYGEKSTLNSNPSKDFRKTYSSKRKSGCTTLCCITLGFEGDTAPRVKCCVRRVVCRHPRDVHRNLGPQNFERQSSSFNPHQANNMKVQLSPAIL